MDIFTKFDEVFQVEHIGKYNHHLQCLFFLFNKAVHNVLCFYLLIHYKVESVTKLLKFIYVYTKKKMFFLYYNVYT